MADPVGVDTPQGSSRFIVEGQEIVAINMPSPPYAVRNGFYTPAQVAVEFDPPIRKAEFHYSRLKNDRAHWGLQGMVFVDSMPVWAMSRRPGTTSYENWDVKVLYSNVERETIPYDTWTYAQLSSGFWGDTIQWLRFDGAIMIDDLKITRKPLDCRAMDLAKSSSVFRGSPVQCLYKGTPEWTVTKWEFLPDLTSLPRVEEASRARNWTGTAAASGVVKVHVTDGTTSRTWQSRLSVMDRDSHWRFNWDYKQGTN